MIHLYHTTTRRNVIIIILFYLADAHGNNRRRFTPKSLSSIFDTPAKCHPLCVDVPDKCLFDTCVGCASCFQSNVDYPSRSPTTKMEINHDDEYVSQNINTPSKHPTNHNKKCHVLCQYYEGDQCSDEDCMGCSVCDGNYVTFASPTNDVGSDSSFPTVTNSSFEGDEAVLDGDIFLDTQLIDKETDCPAPCVNVYEQQRKDISLCAPIDNNRSNRNNDIYNLCGECYFCI